MLDSFELICYYLQITFCLFLGLTMKNLKKILTATTLLSVMLVSLPASAIEKGDILVRTRVINISPDVGSNQIMAGGTALAPPAGIDIDSATTLDIDFTYMFTNNFAVELLLDLTSVHDISGTGNLTGVNIGDVKVLPPSLIAQWHFMPNNRIRPYVGAGVNYTIFFNESTTSQFTATLDTVAGSGAGNPAISSTGLSVDDSFGLVAQAGIDFDINNNWFVNLDAKYIKLDTKATIQANGVDTATVDFDLNPIILGVGIGTRF